jgi:hypothetical protein
MYATIDRQIGTEEAIGTLRSLGLHSARRYRHRYGTVSSRFHSVKLEQLSYLDARQNDTAKYRYQYA